MTKAIRFYVEQQGAQRGIYVDNTRLQNLERNVAEKALSEARAAFLSEFGKPGEFNLEFRWNKVTSNYVHGVRPVYKIHAADAATTAILKSHPGWLDRFAKNAKL